MNAENFRTIIKAVLPKPIRVVLRCIYNYFFRIYLWCITLLQVRGLNYSDELKLWASACLGPIIALHNLHKWQNPMLAFKANLKIKNVGQFAIRPWSDDLWHILPFAQNTVFNWIQKNLKPGDTFVDAGANIGIYTIFSSRIIGPNGKIISIEMMPETFACLKENCQMNVLENISLHQVGLSDFPNQKLRAKFPKGYFGQASLAGYEMSGPVVEVEILTKTLDQILSEYEQIKLIKMDLEGVEAQVLSGATETLKKTNYIIFENWTEVGFKNNSVQQLLEKRNFRIEKIDAKNLVAINQSLHRGPN